MIRRIKNYLQYRKEYKCWLKNRKSQWDEGPTHEILDGDALSKGKIRYLNGTKIESEFREIGKDFGKKVKIWNKEYTLIGLAYTFCDVYLIIIDENGNKTYETCLTKYDTID